MNKQDFLTQLRKELSTLPQEDIEERLTFYSEMIDDRVEDGLSESEAISQLGSINELARQILADMPLTKIVKEKVKSNRALKIWEIAFLILGSPIWLSLLIAVVAIVFAVYVVSHRALARDDLNGKTTVSLSDVFGVKFERVHFVHRVSLI